VIAAGILAVRPDGRALLCKRSDTGQWTVPAGHLERFEMPWDGAQREFQEETGYRGPFTKVRLVKRTNSFGLFRADVLSFHPQLDHEHTDFVWVYPEEAPEPLHLGLRDVVG